MTTRERGSNKSGKSVRAKLEQETASMEQRLVALRTQLERDRKKRELNNKDRDGSNSVAFWSSGQTGFVTTHAQQLIKDMKNSCPNRSRKFKFLTGDSVVDTTTVPHPPLVNDKLQNATLDTSHSISLDGGNLDTDTSDRNSPIKHSLLDGCYNETEGAESFQAALNEWRNAGNETGTETNISMNRNILEFPAFTTNTELTYFDKLILRKYKSEIPKSQSEEKIEISDFHESKLEPSISEYNIFYKADLKIEQQDKNSDSLAVTEITDSDINRILLSGTNQSGINSGTNSGSDMKLKIMTQTGLSGFFLLGTESPEDNNLTNEILDSHSTERVSILGGKIAWNPSDSVSKNSHDYSSSSDSSDSSTLEYFEDKNGGNISEDEDILALEKLSDELATGGISDTGGIGGTDGISGIGGTDGTSGTSGLWTELMCHRPPTSSDFT